MQVGLHTVLPQSTACQNENRGFLMIFSFNLWFLRFTSALALQVPTNETVPKGCKDTINFRDQCSSTGFVKSSVGIIGSRTTHGNTWRYFSILFSSFHFFYFNRCGVTQKRKLSKVVQHGCHWWCVTASPKIYQLIHKTGQPFPYHKNHPYWYPLADLLLGLRSCILHGVAIAKLSQFQQSDCPIIWQS